MKYVIATEHEDGLLLQNVITGQLVLLSSEESKLLHLFPLQYSRIMDPLIDAHFFVQQDFDEHLFVQQLRKILRKLDDSQSPKNIISYTILPTTNCNARCFYCYEAKYHKSNMTENTARQIVDYIEVHSKGKPVNIGWFGGEPTVGEKRIDQICYGLMEKGIVYESQMISNGYLFDEAMVSKAVTVWKLKRIQITLDGTEEVYNSTKSFVNAQESPFQRVVNNIERLLNKGITVGILFNLDYYNFEDLHHLLDDLARRFSGRNNLFIGSHVLFDDEGYNPVRHSTEDHTNLLEKNYQIEDYIIQKGLNLSRVNKAKNNRLPSIQYLYCMADTWKSIIIDPEGNFYKCEHLDEGKASKYGLTLGDIDEEEINSWRDYVELEKCADCGLYPYCIQSKRCPGKIPCYDLDVCHNLELYREVAKRFYDRFIKEQTVIAESENTKNVIFADSVC